MSMVRILLCAVMLVPAGVGSAEHKIGELGGGEDLPMVGRSTFDHVIADPASSTGFSIPYPFGKLLAKLKGELSDPSGLSVLFFPFGRSLQKFAADPDYFRYPRVVVGITSGSKQLGPSLPIDLDSKLFIGFVEPTKQLEVISYNRELGRYEYQIVRDYDANQRPKVFYVKRRLCMTCHESGVPVFPGEPWSETNDNDFIADQIIKARNGEKTYFGQDIVLKDLPNRGFSAEALRFDGAIHEATEIVYNQYRREQICPPTDPSRIDCLAEGYIVALANYYSVWNGPDWQPLVAYKSRVERFYGENRPIEVPHGFIADRDPVSNHAIDALSDQTRPPREISPRALIAMLKSNITYLQAAADPKRSRMTLAPAQRNRCMLPGKNRPAPFEKWCDTKYFLDDFDQAQLAAIKGAATVAGDFRFDRISDAIVRMATRGKKDIRYAFGANKIDKSQFFAELTNEVKALPPPDPCCLQPVKFPMKLVTDRTTSADLLRRAKNPVVRTFLQYCGSCHGIDGIEYPRQFLSADNEVALVDDLRNFSPQILSCLENGETPMPPVASREHLQLLKSPADREMMKEFVRLPDPAPVIQRIDP